MQTSCSGFQQEVVRHWTHSRWDHLLKKEAVAEFTSCARVCQHHSCWKTRNLQQSWLQNDIEKLFFSILEIAVCMNNNQSHTEWLKLRQFAECNYTATLWSKGAAEGKSFSAHFSEETVRRIFFRLLRYLHSECWGYAPAEDKLPVRSNCASVGLIAPLPHF